MPEPQEGNVQNQWGIDPRFNPYSRLGMGAQIINQTTGIGNGSPQDPNQADQSSGADGTGLGYQGETGKQVTENSLGGAASGAVGGAMVAGPVGAAVGGGLGLLKGLFT